MLRHAFPPLLACTLTMAALYAPQPLFPLFRRTMGLSETHVASLMALALLPLAVAPLTFGAVLAQQPAARVLRYGTGALGLAVGAFALASSFWAMAALRVAQGLAIAAILPAVMTYIATSDLRAHLQRYISGYVASAIVGGFLGRLLAGLTATYAPWPLFFGALGVALLACTALLGQLGAMPPPHDEDVATGGYRALLRSRDHLLTYVLIACVFFVFSGLMNFLPFRLHALDPGASELTTGLLYAGYPVGIVVSLSAERIARWLGGPVNAMVAGTALTGVALACVLWPATWALFAAVPLICATMFLTHATAASRVNQLAGAESGAESGAANGLYVAFYYLGGVTGTFVPGPLYERFGWAALVGLLAAVLAAGVAAGLALRRRALAPTA